MLSEELNRINNSVIRIRNKLNVNTAPIEEVARAVEEYKGETDIYKVSTVEEMNELQAKEGDVCLVHTIDEFYYEGSTQTSNTLVFPETIVLDTAVASSTSMTLRCGSNIQTDRLACQLSASYFRVRDYVTYSYIANYTSADGITYTRSSTYDSYTFNGNISLYTSFNAAFTPFLLMRVTDFQGLFKLSGDSWNYLDIGINNNLEEIFTSQTIYDSTGKHSGTFDRSQHDERYIVVSDTEPENKAPIWFKPSTALTSSSYKIKQMKMTKQNAEDMITPETIFTSGYTPSNTAYGSRGSVVVGDIGYIAVYTRLYIYDFVNKTIRYKTLPTPAATGYSWYIMNEGDYIYGLAESTGFRYCISADTVTTISYPLKQTIAPSAYFGYNGAAYFMESYSTSSTDTSSDVPGCLYKFTPSSTSYTTIQLPNALKYYNAYAPAEGGTSLMFVEDNYAYFFCVHNWEYPTTSTGARSIKLAKYNLDTQTIDDILKISEGEEAFTRFRGRINDQLYTLYSTGDLAYSKEAVLLPKRVHEIYKEDPYIYMTSSSSTQALVRLNKEIVKEALQNKDMDLLLDKKYVNISYEAAMNYIICEGRLLYYNGDYYTFTADSDTSNWKIVKQKYFNMEDPISIRTYYLVIDTSTAKYGVNLYEKEYMHFNDIYFFDATKVVKDASERIISGEIYLYDTAISEYRKIN